MAERGEGFTFVFSDLEENPSSVRILSIREKLDARIGVSVDDSSLSLLAYKEIPSAAADLIDIAASIYVADWIGARDPDEICNINIVVPVRNYQIWSNVALLEELQGLLAWYTGDHWSFEITRRKAVGRRSERQRVLPIGNRTSPNGEINEMALWSGGLDSLAGLCYRIQDGSPDKRFGLLGVGTNTIVSALQMRVARSTRELHPTCPIPIAQIDFHLTASGTLPKNRMLRSRGLVFKIMGIAGALGAGLNELHIYENGVGALNLPFSEAEIGIDHTRAVHPLSLNRFGRFASNALGRSISVLNPFLYWTKGEMCQVLKGGREEQVIAVTESCDSHHRLPNQPRQCGYCSSCLLRRQALAAARIHDQTAYVSTNGGKSNFSRDVYLRLMLHQIGELNSYLSADDPWEALIDRFPILFDVASSVSEVDEIPIEDVRDKLIDLYGLYVEEWNRVAKAVATGFLGTDEVGMLLTRRRDVSTSSRERIR